MTRKNPLLLLGTALGLILGGAALGSNMGFKCIPRFATVDPDIYDVSLPVLNDFTDLANVYNDLATLGCSPAQVTVFHTDQSSCTWNGPFSCNEPLLTGGCVRISVIAPCASWVVVGAHDDAFAFNYPTADPDIYDSSVPYHTTRIDTAGLFSEIPSAAQVTVFNPDQSTCTWNGPFSCNVPYEACKCYRVSVTTAPVNWSPSHY